MTSFTRPIFPFVVGCSRSGTTLLRALLDGHPLVAVPPESHFVLAPDPRALRRALRHEPWFGLWGIEPPELRGLDVADAVRAVFAAYGAVHGKPRYADKTPHYVSHLPLLAERFAEARFVHVVRDGRDVASRCSRCHGGRTISRARRNTGAGVCSRAAPPGWGTSATASCATRRSSPIRSASCVRWPPGSSCPTTQPCWTPLAVPRPCRIPSTTVASRSRRRPACATGDAR